MHVQKCNFYCINIVRAERDSGINRWEEERRLSVWQQSDMPIVSGCKGSRRLESLCLLFTVFCSNVKMCNIVAVIGAYLAFLAELRITVRRR